MGTYHPVSVSVTRNMTEERTPTHEGGADASGGRGRTVPLEPVPSSCRVHRALPSRSGGAEQTQTRPRFPLVASVQEQSPVLCVEQKFRLGPAVASLLLATSTLLAFSGKPHS